MADPFRTSPGSGPYRHVCRNCIGIGFVLCAAPEDADDLRQELADAGEEVYAIGRMATLHEPAPPGTLVVSAEGAALR